MRSTRLLSALRDELIELAAQVVSANARVDVVGNQLRESSGSAWLYADCLWVTNNHVVDNARGKVTLSNGGRRLSGLVIGKDADTDLAVIRVEEPVDAKPLEIRADSVRLGELCFAVGAPLGDYADTLSMGVISGLNRRLVEEGGRVIEDVLQTDAAINHGNSGGPLVDIDAHVIGVNTAGIESANSIGFAIPVQTVAEIIPELVESGSITRATIGAKIEVRKFASSPAPNLVVLETLDARSPLRPGDVLRVFDGRPLTRRWDLMRSLRRNVVDREVPVVIERDGKRETISVTPKRRGPTMN